MPVPRIGVAYAAYVPELVRRRKRLVDFVELPFERLRHEPAVGAIVDDIPVVLHCASLSVAGLRPASDRVIEEVRGWAVRTRTPWIGEHLAFVSAEGEGGAALEIGYTVAPPLNATTLERVVAACARYQAALGVPLLLENPPQYFVTPGSTCDQPSFIRALCERSDVGLLLDVSHLLITMRNQGLDPARTLAQLPLERVREIHVSGIREEMDTAWDDHGVSAPEEAFDLLARVLARSRPAAVTLEYNWSAVFPEDVVVAHLDRVRRMTRARARA